MPHNDAGHGTDAPDAPDPALVVTTNEIHSGFSPGWPIDAYDHYAFDAVAGQRIEADARGYLGCHYVLDPTGIRFEESYGCSFGEAFSTALSIEAPVTGRYYLQIEVVAGGPYRFGVSLDAPLPSASLALGGPPPPPLPGPDPTCGTGSPIAETAGAGDGGLPDLVWAALKTGGRAVVAWSTTAAEPAGLRYNLDGGPTVELSDPVPKTQHVFVVDALPVGRAFCFTPLGPAGPSGNTHAMRLANAMNAHDGTTYTINLLVLANEQPHRVVLEDSLVAFAAILRDATDGQVGAGRTILVYNDHGHHNSGWASCYGAVRILMATAPTCNRVFDVIFTNDAFPGGAASTYVDGIQDPDAAIWMNGYFQAPLVGLSDNTGAVLTHEMGHYAFGAQDLYTNQGLGPDCYDATTGISVMGASREATEFDDEVNRCPNEPRLAGYVPTWTQLRARFPLVPDRSGVIDPGPTTVGPTFALHAFAFAPLASSVVTQNDAGSQRDAPDTRSPDVRIAPGVVYTGTSWPLDLADWYAFSGTAGQVVNVVVRGSVGCYAVVTEAGTDLGDRCSYSWAHNSGPLSVTLPAGGTYYLRTHHLAPAAYRFAFELDGEPPSVGPI